MILDLDQFIRKERPFWEELEAAVARDRQDGGKMDLPAIRRFHYLFERTASDLTRVKTFAAEPELKGHLESLIGQAYAQLHSRRRDAVKFRPLYWLFVMFPQTFRRHITAFWISLAISLLGAFFGAFFVSQDAENKALLMPAQFAGHLSQTPSQRVADEEANADEHASLVANQSAAFSAQLMNNNIRVALRALAMGILAGVLTVGLLFYNGIILGLVGYDYVADGQTEFLVAWLLPHGVPELTAIFIGGQAGLVLARAIIGWGTHLGLRSRLRLIRDDIATLAGGLAIMLVWAGIIEAFLSQYHGKALYPWKTGFGLVELVCLVAVLAFAGRKLSSPQPS